MKKRLSEKDATIEIVLFVVGVFLISKLCFTFNQESAIDDIFLPFLGVLMIVSLLS